MIQLLVALKKMENKQNDYTDLYKLYKFIQSRYDVDVKNMSTLNSFLKEFLKDSEFNYSVKRKLDLDVFIVEDGELVENPNYKKQYFEVYKG